MKNLEERKGSTHFRKRIIILATFSFIVFLLITIFPFHKAKAEITSTTTYTNALVNGPDPFMVYSNGYYYYLKTEGSAIDIWRSRSLVDLEHATVQRVYTPPASGPGSQNIWAPELHFLDNKWYIYFAADDGNDVNHRMYALESTSTDPMGSYALKGKVYDASNDTWAIDGTIFRHSDNNLYFVWSGRAQNDTSLPQYLYIAPMSNPYTISGNRVAISVPTYAWENQGGAVNEGPSVLQRNGKTFIVYSASFFNTPDYCLGMLTNSDGIVLSALSWTKTSTPVFSKTDTVFGPGHNAFTTSVDGSEDYLIYHARNTTSTSEPRSTRAQKFTWNADGTPNFGIPVTAGVNLPLPVGDIPGNLVVDRFVLTDVSGIEKTTFIEGEAIYPKVIIHNIGLLGVDTPSQLTYEHFYSDAPAPAPVGQVSDVNVYLKNGEFPAEFAKEYGASPVGPNSSFYAGSTSWTKPAGTYTARVFANYDNSGIESSYMDNQSTIPYTVIPTPSPTPTPTPSPTPAPVSCTMPIITSHSDTNPTGGGTVSFSWDPVAGAFDYRVQRQNSSGTWSTRATTSSTSFTGNDASNDPYWKVFVYSGTCSPLPGPATIFNP